MFAKLLSSNSRGELLIFCIVGVIATLTHYFSALLVHEVLNWPLWLCNIFGYLSAVSVSYIGHGKFTFKAKHSTTLLQRFTLVSIATVSLSELLLILLEIGLNWPAQLTLLIIATTIPTLSYLFNRLWVFKQ